MSTFVSSHHLFAKQWINILWRNYQSIISESLRVNYSDWIMIQVWWKKCSFIIFCFGITESYGGEKLGMSCSVCQVTFDSVEIQVIWFDLRFVWELVYAIIHGHDWFFILNVSIFIKYSNLAWNAIGRQWNNRVYRERCFCLVTSMGQRKILSPLEELNLIPLGSAFWCSEYHWAI